MFKKLLLAISIGLLITSVVIQKDPTFKKILAAQFRHAFEQAYDCSLSCTLRDISILGGRVTLQNMRACSSDGDQWSWRCAQYRMSFSWLHALLYRTLELHVEVDDLVIESSMHNGVVAVAPHMQKLMVIPDLPVALILRSLSVRNARCVLGDNTADVQLAFAWRSESRQIEKMFKTNMFLVDGTGSVAGKIFYTSPQGLLHVDVSGTASNFSTQIKTNCSFVLPHLGSDSTCYVIGSLADGNGRFVVQNASKSLLVSPITMHEERGTTVTELQARFPLACAQGLLGRAVSGVDGTCTARIRYEQGEDQSYGNGQVFIDDMRYGDRRFLETMRLSCSVDGDMWRGKVYMRHLPCGELVGSWSWDKKDGVSSLQMTNNVPLKYSAASYWLISPQQLELNCAIDTHGVIKGNYKAPVSHSKLSLTHTIAGQFECKDGDVHLSGSCDEDTYELTTTAAGQPPTFTYTSKNGTQLLSVERDEQNNVRGAIQFPLIKTVVNQLTGYELQGQGAVELAGTYENDLYKVQVHLNDAHIRLPQTYNFVHNMKADVLFDARKRRFVVSDLVCDLHRGKVRSARMVCTFDERGKPTFVHAPCTFDKCLLNLERDLFTIVSGSLMLTKQPNVAPALQGTLILERSHLKRNIFNESFQHRLFTFDTDPLAAFDQPLSLDLLVQTKHPIQIRTSFLETSAKIALKIKHDRTAPALSGSINLLGGSITFPYTSLYISKGTISFVPQQWHDPLIELVAKNNIRRHVISMRATGSLKQHHIAFESTSSLTEEQIIALLLAGSEEGSLDVVMPALIMQNVKSMIFGPEDSASTVTSYFKKILEPLKRIHLVPSFSDQTGRGGFRGALEIDVSDRWHARLQKNFSLSEDTKFEVEYQLSDDMSLKGTRDERGDVSGEVEMRWKF